MQGVSGQRLEFRLSYFASPPCSPCVLSVALSDTPIRASWTATLAREGKIHSWKTNPSPTKRGGAPLPLHNRPGWNERIPVWEQRIPAYQSQPRQLQSFSGSRSSGLDGGRNNPFMSSQVSNVSAKSVCDATVDCYVSPAMTHSRACPTQTVVTRDWSLLFSPGRVDLTRRPWPGAQQSRLCRSNGAIPCA